MVTKIKLLFSKISLWWELRKLCPSRMKLTDLDCVGLYWNIPRIRFEPYWHYRKRLEKTVTKQQNAMGIYHV